MHVSQDQFDLSPTERRGVDTFKDRIWYNSEVCNSCFSQVRSVGPTVTKRLREPSEKLLENGEPLDLEMSEWYERTENGSQEYTTWDDNKRFGTCFCLDCGTDCTGNHRHKTVDELKPIAANIYEYITTQTPLDLDHKRFGREIRELKSVPEYQGFETEILAIAFARALE